MKKRMPAKAAAKRVLHDRTLLGAIGAFSAVSIVFCYRVSSDELLKILIGTVGAFFIALLRYMYGGKAE